MNKTELFVPVDQGKLFCRVYGRRDTPPVIVMHGGPGLGHGYLLPQMQEIGAFCHAIFYDQRGAGQSETSDAWQANPFETYVRDVDQLREFFGVEKVSLLTHSWGGVLASHYALRYPQHVDKMIYLNSVPISSTDYLEFVKHRSQLVDTFKAEMDVIRASSAFAKGDPATIEKFYRIYFRKYFAKPEFANTLSLTMSPTAAINNFKIYNFFYDYVTKHSFDLYAGLKALNKSTLIVAGDKDVIPLHYTERLHASVPASKYILLKDCGHFSYIDQPEILFEMLAGFIEK